MKILRSAFIGLLLGLILSILADRSVWLEMRVNTGLLLPLATAIALIAGAFSQRQAPARVVVGMEVLLFFLLLLVYGPDPQALLIIPASAVKEGFFLSALNLRTLNGILAAVFLLGNSALIISRPSRH